MIYLVEDDDSIRDLMVYTLSASGFEARGFAESTSFWKAAADQLPDLVILDIMLPGEDGLSILKKLKEQPRTADIPVIMATARDSEYDTVTGLDLGADDYLAKPFGMMEMVSRVRAVMRRARPKKKSSLLCLNGIVMDRVRHTVSVDEKPVHLTLKEYDLLELFMTNPGQVFTREQLLQAVWGSDFMGESRTVDVHVGTLRTKLGEKGNAIRTVRGVGYRMEDENEP